MLSIPYTSPWLPGDTIGIGLKYCGKSKYSTFLTKNGIIAGDEMNFETCQTLTRDKEFAFDNQVQYTDRLTMKNTR